MFLAICKLLRFEDEERENYEEHQLLLTNETRFKKESGGLVIKNLCYAFIYADGVTLRE